MKWRSARISRHLSVLFIGALRAPYIPQYMVELQARLIHDGRSRILRDTDTSSLLYDFGFACYVSPTCDHKDGKKLRNGELA